MPSGGKAGGLRARERTARCLGGTRTAAKARCGTLRPTTACCARLVVKWLIPTSWWCSGGGSSSVCTDTMERGDVSTTQGGQDGPRHYA
jgi:hypothetical protein